MCVCVFYWEKHQTQWGMFQQTMFDYQRVRARSPDRFSFLRCPYGGSIAGNNKHLATMTNAECGDNGCFKVFHGYSTWADATKWVLVKVWARTDPHMWYSCCSTKSTWSIMVGDGLPILTQMINLMFPKMWGTPNHPFIFILWETPKHVQQEHAPRCASSPCLFRSRGVRSFRWFAQGWQQGNEVRIFLWRMVQYHSGLTSWPHWNHGSDWGVIRK